MRDIKFGTVDQGVSLAHVRDPRNAAIAERLYSDECGTIVYELDAFTVSDGEWGQLEHNGRYVGLYHGEWWYEHCVYNVFRSTDVDVTRFVDTKPTHRFVELASLF